MKKDEQQNPEQDDRPVLTMELFQEIVGKMMRASQQANWEKKKKSEKSKDRSEQEELLTKT